MARNGRIMPVGTLAGWLPQPGTLVRFRTVLDRGMWRCPHCGLPRGQRKGRYILQRTFRGKDGKWVVRSAPGLEKNWCGIEVNTLPRADKDCCRCVRNILLGP